MTDYLIYSFYQNGMFCLEDNLFYEDNKRLGYSEDEKDGSIVSNNHKEVVNRLSELKELNIELKRENKTFRKENGHLKHRLAISEKANFVTALEKENEQLKKENYELHKRLGDFKPFEEHIQERTSKTSVNDIIGLVKTDEPTNSVELKKEK